MARIAQGWTLRKIGRKYYVRFRLPSGERCELTTGQSDPGLAQAEAARIYAERLTPPKSAPPTGVRLDEPGSIRNQGDRRGSNPRQLEPQGSEQADLSMVLASSPPETDGVGGHMGEGLGETSIGRRFAADVILRARQEDAIADEWGECVAAALAGDEARYLEHALPLVRALWGA